MLLYRSPGLGFTVPPLFEIDHLGLRPSLFDLFIYEDDARKDPVQRFVLFSTFVFSSFGLGKSKDLVRSQFREW